MFNSGTSEDAISELETRLAVSLPEDYKEFLRITNGFGDGGCGIFTGILTDPGLMDLSRVKWTRQRQIPADLLRIPRAVEEEFGGFETKCAEDGPASLKWDTAVPLFKQVVEIGSEDIFSIILVPPKFVAKVKAAYEIMLRQADPEGKAIVLEAIDHLAGSKLAFDDMEWACCTIGDAAELTSFSSFRSYLEHAATESMGGES